MHRLLLCCLVLTALYSLHAFAQSITADDTPVHIADFSAHRNEVIHDRTSRTETSTDASRLPTAKGVQKTVFGYYPYWTEANFYEQLDYNILTHIGYFSADIDSNGTVLLMNGDRLTPLRDYARQRDTKVILVATCFGYATNDKVLGDSATSLRAISAILKNVRQYNLDGVNVDAELVRESQRAHLVRFMQWLSDSLQAYKPAAELSMATPAVDWSNAFNLPQLASLCDYLIVMGYDYYYSGSPTAGPVAPLAGENYNVTRSVQTYLQSGMPSQKLLLGVPWYGYEWATMDTTRKAARDVARGAGKSYIYAQAERRAQHVKLYDAPTHSNRYTLINSTGAFQGWFDDSTTLGEKYALVNTSNLGGIGIWALSYEGTDGKLRTGINEAFARITTTESQETTPNLRITPQPAHDVVNVELPSAQDIAVYDILGNRMMHEQAQSLRISLDCSALPSGWYWLRTATMSLPFVIQH